MKVTVTRLIVDLLTDPVVIKEKTRWEIQGRESIKFNKYNKDLFQIQLQKLKNDNLFDSAKRKVKIYLLCYLINYILKNVDKSLIKDLAKYATIVIDMVEQVEKYKF